MRYLPLTLILVLLGSLAVSQAAPAAVTSPVAPTPTVPATTPHITAEAEEEEAEGEGEEFGIEECGATAEEFEFEGEEEAEEEEVEFEAEECGEEEKKSTNGSYVTAPEQCQVRRAESSITTIPGSDQVRLTVHYITYSPASVTVGLKLKDHKGTVEIEHTTKHLGAKGVLQLTSKVSDAVMERATKAKEFDVSLRAANTPGYCGSMLEQQLKSKHPVGNARVYTVAVPAHKS